MEQVLAFLYFLLLGRQISNCSPIVDPRAHIKTHQQQYDNKLFCQLPTANGVGGSYRYLEDCPNITNFEFLPVPAPHQDLGIHPYVCCPRIGAGTLCFPSDTWCTSFSPPNEYFEYEGDDYDEYEGDDYDGDTEYAYEDNEDYFEIGEAKKVSENVCPNRFNGDPTSACINFKECEGILDDDISSVDVCGWDESEKALKVCCPRTAIEPRKKHHMSYRFTKKPEVPYNCSNKADQVSQGMCTTWRENGACDTDKHFDLSNNTSEDTVTSHDMFHFMMMSCMETCDRCKGNTCQDEHPLCRTWARKNMCSLNPWFMGHTCRESCGVCGFLSPFDKTIQQVGGNTYSDVRDDKFDCGRTSKHKDIANKNTFRKAKRKKRQATDSENDVFFATESEENDFSCAATIVSDRWAVSAAHCYPNFGISSQDDNGNKQPRKIQLKVIRDYNNSQYLEHLEVKRVYQHPNYNYPNLYNDIAVVELGRRIEYDFEKYGDTPACLNNQENIIGQLASVQGYGFNENGLRGRLQVTGEVLKVITQDECKEMLRYNVTGRNGYKRKLLKALPNGLNDQLLCVQGVYNETSDVFPGSCKGDSGGPLFLYPDSEQTLVGIVSGGIGCGEGIPGWYTKVSFFARWLICIMESSVSLNNNQDAIQQYCNRFSKLGSVDGSNWLD